MRERLPVSHRPSLAAGITPACAGKTDYLGVSKSKYRDHPRMCGKDLIFLPAFACQAGSPPHVRERQIIFDSNAKQARITPACAGKTNTVIDCTPTPKDHPRMCGKDRRSSTLSWMILGSPPHVRERHHKKKLAKSWKRITPACAGKTNGTSYKISIGGDHPRMCGKDLSDTLT